MSVIPTAQLPQLPRAAQDVNQYGQDRMDSAMQRLKQSTHALHQQVEQQLNLPTFTTSLTEYQELLRRFYGLYQPLEEALAALPWHTVDFDFASRRKLPLLRQDLQALGDSIDRINAIPTIGTLPALSTLARGFGTLYVLEGSTLGGQLILRRLQRSLGVTVETGGAFFGSYGPALGLMWKSFGAQVDRYAAAHPAAVPEMIDAACTTFLSFESLLGMPQ